MVLTIWLPVATVNAIIFFLVDTPALHAIHQGLLPLQGYYLLTRVQAGYKVPLARSRIPIVGGELLRGITRWPSAFILINSGVLVCVFFATLGVDAKELNPFVSSSFNFTTTLSEPFNRTLFINPPNKVLRNLTCRTSNGTHAQYWNSAFNATQISRTAHVIGNELSCQAKAPKAQPMLTAQCVRKNDEDECLLESISFLLIPKFSNLTVAPTIHRFTSSRWVEEYVFSEIWAHSKIRHNLSTVTMPSQIIGSNVRMFGHRATSSSFSNITAIFFFHNGSTNSWYSTAGKYLHEHNCYVILPLLQLSFHGTNSIEFLFAAIRNTSAVSERMGHSDKDSAKLVEPVIELFDETVRLMLRGIPVSRSKAFYVKMPLEDVTIIDNKALVLYSIIVSLALLLIPVKRILLFCLVRRGMFEQSQVFCYEYDQMSKNFRAFQEQTSGMPLSGEYVMHYSIKDHFKHSSGFPTP